MAPISHLSFPKGVAIPSIRDALTAAALASHRSLRVPYDPFHEGRVNSGDPGEPSLFVVVVVVVVDVVVDVVVAPASIGGAFSLASSRASPLGVPI